MRLLSWIFQPVYLIFFLIIAALYIYRGDLFPQFRDAEQTRSLVAQMEQTAAAIVEENQAVESIVISESEPSAEPSPTKSEAALLSEQQSVATQPVDDSVTKVEVEQLQPQTSGTETESNQVAIENRPPEVEPSEASDSVGALWYAARKAAWGGDSALAIERYRQLTSNYPEHADGYGELGNIYYAQGELSSAVDVYRQALNIYQTSDQSGAALQLQKSIVEIETEMAKR
ncbi:MAG: tetratricopeptide repeat protein [Gammaproteobacteria bacterium]|nr:tetratricopeptide repeat protein [Gammaproteobacteria bacterium]